MQHSPLKIEYEEFIAKHAFDLSSELLVSKYAMLLLFNFVTQTNFIPLPDPQTITSSLPIALYFYYNNDYKAVGVRSVFSANPEIIIQICIFIARKKIKTLKLWLVVRLLTCVTFFTKQDFSSKNNFFTNPLSQVFALTLSFN